MLAMHILAGGIGLIAGYLALYSAKGAPFHRQAGMVFVYAMLAMCLGGVVLAVAHGAAPALNVPAALLTASLVTTGLTTVRPPSRAIDRLNRAATVVTLAVGVAALALAFDAAAAGGRARGMAYPLFMFAAVAFLAGAGDLRAARLGPMRGTARVARHLWRMSFALAVAALSFFVGQADVIPAPMRDRGLLALPALAVLATMVWWLWRLRVSRGPRATVNSHLDASIDRNYPNDTNRRDTTCRAAAPSNPRTGSFTRSGGEPGHA